jgi:predicted nucleotidyltransferase
MSRVAEILEKKRHRRALLERQLALIVDQLKRLGALRIILFGSLARERVDTTSDLDLLAIMPSTRSGSEWLKTVYESVDRGVACDIITYNEDEFRDERDKKRFVREVLASGKVIYDAA